MTAVNHSVRPQVTRYPRLDLHKAYSKGTNALFVLSYREPTNFLPI